jgi:hypothetical protein
MASIYQRPGETVTFGFSFDSNQENCVKILRDGAEVANRNSDGDSSTYSPGKNTTGQILHYSVAGLYKLHRGGGHGWNPSWERQDVVNGNKIVIGFEDMTPDGGRDGDYNDAQVTVTYS